MANKNLDTRIINKHDTEENWSKANFIPKQGELIIYDKDDNYDIERFKIGDGITSVNNLPFRNIDGGYDVFTEILPETTLNFTDSTSLTLTNCPPIELGKKYIVTFDNTDYELIGREDSQSMGNICIGNELYGLGGTDTGEPFAIYSMKNNTHIDISPSTTLPCTYNIKIKSVTLVKIDEKYLDIKNTNIVNGSALGSLRTVCSAEESSSYTMGQYAFAEGWKTTASGFASHAEGQETTASESRSHAEGYLTKALGDNSHAEGGSTKASGSYSHAEGSNTTASGDYSHVEGRNTTASSDYQHVQGRFNIGDSNNIYADIVGNGSPPRRYSNAYTLDWSGNGWFSGDVYVGSTSGKNKDDGSKKLATEDYVNSAISSSIVVDSELSDTSENPVQNKVVNTALSNKMDKTNPTGTGSFSLNRMADTTVGDYSFAEGYNTTASGVNSHAEGNYTTASGSSSHAEGSDTTASGDYSHAEGSHTKALGDYSHAEGLSTTAGQMGFKVTACEKLTDTTGTYTLTSVTGLEVNQRYSIHLSSSKENCGNITAIDTTNKKVTVDGYPDIGFGNPFAPITRYLTIVNRPDLGDVKFASYSHAEGDSTIASSFYQHVQGRLNIEDSIGTYADIIGNGNVKGRTRSNAATVDWNGNAWYAGDVYVGSTSGTNKDEGSKKLATEDYVDNHTVTVDSEMLDNSTNPVQNKIIKAYIDNIVISDIDSIRSNATNGQTAYEMLSGVETLLSNI